MGAKGALQVRRGVCVHHVAENLPHRRIPRDAVLHEGAEVGGQGGQGAGLLLELLQE
eukprot:CAMPEP_0173371610 /NCGR_PEP_ID=MMETSP1144-20121109/27384_1 /TAXON_ID=483371 /ORGANISM="non described non described, Strain CCMP2298" /LENGTH=56 /DNA_ID=CAMNT_0014323385 /DNA_START=75 /DNA_END=245 /DNA_ORIENTATION=+